MNRIVIAFTCAVMLWGCAKQTNPTGGPKDEDPPVLIRSTPENRQTRYRGQTIELVFNEYVQVNNAREQIIIVPPAGKKFEALAKKNKVIVKLNASLQENTTYTINFREAIQDLSERNPARNLKLAFSTGTYIDSLVVEGTVYDLLKGAPSENFTVAVAPFSDTLTIFRHAAQFFTLTNKEGKYSIENLRPGNYLLYAFQDKNKNLIVDSRSESFGFRADTLQLNQSLKQINLYTNVLDMRPLKIISAKPIGNHFLIRTNKGYHAYTVATVLPDTRLAYDQPDFTSLRFYNTLAGADSLPIRFTATDSIAHQIDTILYVKFAKTALQNERFNAKIENLRYLENRQTLKGTLTFSKPIRSITYDSILIRLDSIQVIGFRPDDFNWDKSFTSAGLTKRLEKAVDFTITKQQRTNTKTGMERRTIGEGRPREEPLPKAPDKNDTRNIYNQLIICKGTFVSVESDSSNLLVTPISIIKPENSATLLTEVQSSAQTITQVLDKNYTVIESSAHTTNRFENLAPGEYYIRIIVDINRNRLWDPGNYYLRQGPEPMIFYEEENGNKKINLKANWEVGPLLIRY
jgi:uncharacterized protein (DUF2141 family)